MARGMGGWMGPERSLGGMPRTFGLHNQPHGSDRPTQPIDRVRLRRVVQYLKPYWRQWLLIFLCIGAAAGLGVLPPLCVRGILDEAIPRHDVRWLNLMVGSIVGLVIVSGLIGVLQNYVVARVGQSIAFDLRVQLYRHLQRLSLRFYTTTRGGEIVSRLTNDVGAVQGVTTGTLISIVSNLLNVTATLVVIFSMSWKLALLAITVVPTFYAPTRLVGRVRRRLSLETQERQADVMAFMQERLQIGGMLLSRLFGRSESDLQTFEERSREVMELHIRQAMAGRWLFLCLSILSVAGPAMIYWYGGLQAIRGQLTVGTIIAFVAYLTNLYRPLGQLANVYVDVQGAMAVFERIFEFLDLEPDVADAATPVAMPTTQGAIRFDDVKFIYPPPYALSSARGPESGPRGGSSRPALDGVSFAIEPGQRVALVGPSGAGKTTVTYLIPRFYDPTAGRITLDGVDLREVPLDDLRAHLGMVTQETFLFHATVRENLLYARPAATDAEIEAACRAAQIHEFITGLPDQYETMVGERAFRLSGGEKQRLAIARAILKDPRILVLDEATSNLDATSEYLIQQALEALLQNRTAVIIAHRLSTILNADRILVLDRGRLVEDGCHADLLAQGGLYATLYHQQFSRVLDPGPHPRQEES